MDQSKIDRINELSRKSRECALSPEECAEQKKLRAEYVAAFRACLEETLDNTVIERPDGTKEKLKRREKSS
ncbi:DUF896 domain-containing protein [Oscillospiraceae bacterium WX1]